MSDSWWLRSGNAAARRITPGGLLLGRSAHCDVVIPSERASRRQALVYLGADGPRLEVLGRGLTQVGDRPVERGADLSDGDRLVLDALELVVSREDTGPPVAESPPVWVLEDPSGALFGMARSPFCVGGGDDDDLRVVGWPTAALRFRTTVDGGLEVLATLEVTVDGAAVAPAQPARLRPGAAVEIDGRRVKVMTGGAFTSGRTAAAEPRGILRIERVRLEFLPRGGRLTLVLGGEAQTVYLSDRRCDLVAVLLRPPEPQAAGDFVEDDVVIGRVWGRQPADRTNLNVLLHRVRKDLAQTGVDGHALLERSDGGGATRFAIDSDAAVELV